MILESICLGHLIGAGILVVLFFLVGHLVKPASIVQSMSPAEENQYDLMQQDKNGHCMAVQLKENVTHGKHEQEALACH
jgi:GH24 family phage-related lysozyme (muramidase)